MNIKMVELPFDGVLMNKVADFTEKLLSNDTTDKERRKLIKRMFDIKKEEVW